MGGQALQQLLFFALLVFGLYVLAIRPQRTRAKALAQVRAALEPGRRVMTTAGIHATVEEAFTPKQPSREEALEARIAELERLIGQLTIENSVLEKLSRATSHRGML